MPSRVIREGLLDSQRYWSVGIEARQLFVHLMLLADDFGLVSLAPIFIRRRCFDDAPTPAKIDKVLEQLHDADLIRIYTDGIEPVGRFGFIPRFGQRMRQMRAKHPMPPDQLFADDHDAKELFRQYKPLFEKSPAGRRQAADGSPQPADKPRPDSDLDLDLESKGRETKKGIVELTLDGGQPPDPKIAGKEQLRQQAVEVIAFLNEQTGRRFDAAKKGTLKHVTARLREGESVEVCKAVIALKVREWKGDRKMAKHLCPSTLFNEVKFEKYKASIGAPPVGNARDFALASQDYAAGLPAGVLQR